jgi:hypothetical protein
MYHSIFRRNVCTKFCVRNLKERDDLQDPWHSWADIKNLSSTNGIGWVKLILAYSEKGQVAVVFDLCDEC